MTPSELKYKYETANPDGYFFTRKTMGFFGDTMRNYGVSLFTHNGEQYAELRRKRPVKHGMQGSHYFNLETMDSSTVDPRKEVSA